jgi:two-component system NtrC family sensor kinase
LVTATNRMAAGDLNQMIPVKSSDELGDLTRSFNRMVLNLSRIQKELVRSEKLISLGRLSAGVAHEIRNPLNAMKGAMVHLGQKWGHEPLIRQYTQLVAEEIDRLDRVVSEFLYFSKQAPPKLETADINGVILGTEELLAGEAAKEGRALSKSAGNISAIDGAGYPSDGTGSPQSFHQCHGCVDGGR